VHVSEHLSFTCLGKASQGKPGPKPESGNPTFRERVQEKLVCSVGDRPTKVIVRSLVAWIAERREIEFLMPIDKAIFQDGEQVIGP
jgi:hypothetical protein